MGRGPVWRCRQQVHWQCPSRCRSAPRAGPWEGGQPRAPRAGQSHRHSLIPQGTQPRHLPAHTYGSLLSLSHLQSAEVKLAHSLQSVASDDKPTRPSSTCRREKAPPDGSGAPARRVWEAPSPSGRALPNHQASRPTGVSPPTAQDTGATQRSCFCAEHIRQTSGKKRICQNGSIKSSKTNTASSVRLASRGARARQLPEPRPPSTVDRRRTPSLTHKCQTAFERSL